MLDNPATERLDFDLSDRLTKKDGWVYMTGMQARCGCRSSSTCATWRRG